MDIVNPLAEMYAQQHSSVPESILQEIEHHTLTNHAHPHMISGAVQGKFLEMISEMITPSRILEIGTFTGYSAICLSKGLNDNGILHTIEIREDDAALANSNFKKAGVEHKIKLHVGNALDIIPELEENWDLIFIDADKVSYISYYELTLPKLRKGGWMIIDNVLFHGQVLESSIKGKNAKSIHEFNNHIGKDSRIEKIMLTIRDGITLIKKR